MELIDRINEVIKGKGLNPRSFAKTINFNYSTLNNYIVGRRKTIDSVLLINILNTYQDVSAEWLLRGLGDMYMSDHNNYEYLKEEVISLRAENNILKKIMKIKEIDNENTKVKNAG